MWDFAVHVCENGKITSTYRCNPIVSQQRLHRLPMIHPFVDHVIVWDYPLAIYHLHESRELLQPRNRVTRNHNKDISYQPIMTCLRQMIGRVPNKFHDSCKCTRANHNRDISYIVHPCVCRLMAQLQMVPSPVLTRSNVAD